MERRPKKRSRDREREWLDNISTYVTHESQHKRSRITAPGDLEDYVEEVTGGRWSVSVFQTTPLVTVDTAVDWSDWGATHCKVSSILRVDDGIVRNLKYSLLREGLLRNDWRAGQPIMNIIDPDLFVFKLFDAEEGDYYDDEEEGDYAYGEEQGDYFDEDCYDEEHYNEHYVYDDAGRPGCGRDIGEHYDEHFGVLAELYDDEFQWLATEFVEKCAARQRTFRGWSPLCKDHIRIVSPIHNLAPRTKFEHIYKGIEHVFEHMLPLFNEFDVFRLRARDRFQVIVKSQRYCIADGTDSTGNWQTEGLNENIVLVGLFFVEKERGLTGGDLKFRKLSYSNHHFESYGNCQPHACVVEEGTAVVFDNRLVAHRFKMLGNRVGDGVDRHRTLVAFFVVDPEKETPVSTLRYPSLRRSDFVDVLTRCAGMPKVVAVLVCEYARCGMSLQEAKAIRRRGIDFRQNAHTKGGWAEMDHADSLCGEHKYGGCIDVSWHDSVQHAMST